MEVADAKWMKQTGWYLGDMAGNTTLVLLLNMISPSVPQRDVELYLPVHEGECDWIKYIKRSFKN